MAAPGGDQRDQDEGQESHPAMISRERTARKENAREISGRGASALRWRWLQLQRWTFGYAEQPALIILTLATERPIATTSSRRLRCAARPPPFHNERPVAHLPLPKRSDSLRSYAAPTGVPHWRIARSAGVSVGSRRRARLLADGRRGTGPLLPTERPSARIAERPRRYWRTARGRGPDHRGGSMPAARRRADRGVAGKCSRPLRHHQARPGRLALPSARAAAGWKRRQLRLRHHCARPVRATRQAHPFLRPRETIRAPCDAALFRWRRPQRN